jgi:hypothetical protein
MDHSAGQLLKVAVVMQRRKYFCLDGRTTGQGLTQTADISRDTTKLLEKKDLLIEGDAQAH